MIYFCFPFFMQKQLKPKETLLHVFRRLIVPVIVYYFFLSRMLCAFGPFLGFVSGLILNSFDFQIEHGWVDRINFHLFSSFLSCASQAISVRTYQWNGFCTRWRRHQIVIAGTFIAILLFFSQCLCFLFSANMTFRFYCRRCQLGVISQRRRIIGLRENILLNNGTRCGCFWRRSFIGIIRRSFKWRTNAKVYSSPSKCPSKIWQIITLD